MGNLLVRILHKRTQAVLGTVKTPMPRGADWAAQAKSTAIREWRRTNSDYATPVSATIIPAEEA